MNSFRDSIAGGRGTSGPVMPEKQSRLAEAAGLKAVAVPRTESRTTNQRTEERQIVGTGEARLFAGRKSFVVDLLNLSGGGAMICTNVPLKLWQRVQLELAEGDCVECAVRWLKGDRVGLEFAHETQVAGDVEQRDAMLLETIDRNFPEFAVEAGAEADAGEAAPSAAAPGAQRRADLRHPLIWYGQVHYDFASTRVRLRNVSSSGVMVDCTRSIPASAEVLLDMGGAGQHFAIVSWSRGDQLGLRFQQPFDIACLAGCEPDVAPQRWTRPDYLNAGQDTDSPWAEPWQRLSVGELKDRLEGFLKR